MVDGGVIAGYLAAAVARGGQRFLDRKVDAALDQLCARVASRLGQRPHEDLARTPRDPGVQDRVGRAIESAARRDERFARDLAALQEQLDRGGARYLVNQVRAGINAQAFGGGHVHVGDVYEGDRYANDHDPDDELVVGRGVGRLLAAIGGVVLLCGFAGWWYFIFTLMASSSSHVDIRSPFDVKLVSGVPLMPVAFAAFVIGILISGLGTSMSKSKAARKREEELRRRRSW